VLSFFDRDQSLEQSNTIDVRPTQGTFAIHTARVIAPGDPFRSLVYFRMAKLGQGRMPHIGSYQVDAQGLQLVHDWISSLPRREADQTALAAWREEQAIAVKQVTSSAQGSNDVNSGITKLLETTSGAMMLLQAMETNALPASARIQAVAQAAVHGQPHIRDLFERFVPEEQRVKRLGSVIQPDVILAATGVAARGKQLYFNTEGVQCKNCHLLGGVGTALGPDLSKIGGKYNRAQLLETILDPSRSIEKQYVTYVLETRRGAVHTGLLLEQTAGHVKLRDATNKEIVVAADDVELLVPMQKSLMPELQLRDMSVQQAADLLEFLGELK
jgi:putative heme-binding domain-containing protein